MPRRRRRRGEFVIGRRDLHLFDHRRDVLHLVGDVDLSRAPPVPITSRDIAGIAPPATPRGLRSASPTGSSSSAGGSHCRCAFQTRRSRPCRLLAQAVPNRKTRRHRTRRFQTCPRIPASGPIAKIFPILPVTAYSVPSGRGAEPGDLRRRDVQQPRVGMVGVQPIRSPRDCRCRDQSWPCASKASA